MGRITPLAILACCVALISTGTTATAQRVVAPETNVFQSIRDGVVTVYGDRGSGSGFIIHKNGLILTNSHVIENSTRITVCLDDSTRSAGRIVAQDKQKDLAIVWIAKTLCADRPVLEIAHRPSLELAFEGERVIAIGSPLNQTRIMTSGIVSKLEEGAIITDVSINPGNSGGPLLNMDAEVIGVNTFRDPSLGGPGVSGSIPISMARELIVGAETHLNESPPSPLLLPVVPRARFPLGGLTWASERSSDDDNYRLKWAEREAQTDQYSARYDPGFEIRVATPTRSYFLSAEEDRRLAGKRRAREAAAGVADAEMYDPLGTRLREWQAYVGQHAPVVVITVVPKVGETGTSSFLNILGAAAAGYSGTPYVGSHQYEFKADLQDCTLLCNDRPVFDVFRGFGMMPVSISAGTVNMDDIAQRGTFVYLPDVFAPCDSTELSLRLKDLKHPDRDIRVPIPMACREQVWMDFEPYRDMLAAQHVPLQLPREGN